VWAPDRYRPMLSSAGEPLSKSQQTLCLPAPFVHIFMSQRPTSHNFPQSSRSHVAVSPAGVMAWHHKFAVCCAGHGMGAT
jgi:hypothetical protein